MKKQCFVVAGRSRFLRIFAASTICLICQTSFVSAEKTANHSPEWRLPRGDSSFSGFTADQLSDDLVVRWECQVDEAIETTPVVGFGAVFTADIFGKVYAVERETGKLKWKKDYETGFLASPSLRDNTVFIGDVEGSVYALNAVSGEEKWKSKTEGEINGSVNFFEDSVLVASQDGKLYCFGVDQGDLRWTYETQDSVRCSPSIATGRTFLGGCDGQLHQVNLKTGEAIGAPLPLGGPTGSTPAVLQNQVVLPIMDGLVLAFDWKKGRELWRYEDLDLLQEYRSSAAISKDFVVVSSQNRQVDALSVDTGKLKWRYTLKRRSDASPVIAGEDVWIAASDGRLIRLSLKDGKEKWTYEVRGSFLAAPAIVGDELFIGDDDGILRCFAKPEDELP